jgi:hypothetical protein
MKLPIDQTKIAALVTGEARPVLIYGTNEPRTDKDGRSREPQTQSIPPPR